MPVNLLSYLASTSRFCPQATLHNRNLTLLMLTIFNSVWQGTGCRNARALTELIKINENGCGPEPRFLSQYKWSCGEQWETDGWPCRHSLSTLSCCPVFHRVAVVKGVHLFLPPPPPPSCTMHSNLGMQNNSKENSTVLQSVLTVTKDISI